MANCCRVPIAVVKPRHQWLKSLAAAKLQRTMVADVVSQFVDYYQNYAAIVDVVQLPLRQTAVAKQQHQAVVVLAEAALKGCFRKWPVKYQAIVVVVLLAKSLLLLSQLPIAAAKLLLQKVQAADAKMVACLED